MKNLTEQNLVFVSQTENTNAEEILKQCSEYKNSLQDCNEANDLYEKFSYLVGTQDTVIPAGTSSCYYEALYGKPSSYLHILNHILDFKGFYIASFGSTCRLQQQYYTTSLGQTVATNCEGGEVSAYLKYDSESRYVFEKASEILDERYCDGNDNYEGQYNMLEAIYACGATPSEIDFLQSDYIKNYDGTYSLKTLKQKAIDLYYIITNYGKELNIVEMESILVNFNEGDMKNLTQNAESQEFAVFCAEEATKLLIQR